MTEKEKNPTTTTGVTFNGTVTFQGPMFDIHDNQHVETHVYYAQGGTAHLVTPSEQRVKDALEKLLAATDKDGKRVFTQQYQWYAVWKVLQEHQYPKSPKDFAATMQTLLGTTDPPCKYDSIRKIGTDVPHAAESLACWRTLRGRADGQFKHLVEAALTLQELLAQG